MFLFGARKNISLSIKQYDKKTNKQTNKKQVKHGAIQKVCHLHNIIFHSIQLSVTLHRFYSNPSPVLFTKLH